MRENIIQKLSAGLAPSFLEVVDESHQHNVPKGAESHFKVVAVSAQFDGKALLPRHRAIYGLLSEEMSKKRIHALALHTFTPEEWAKETSDHKSPACLGGSKAEK